TFRTRSGVDFSMDANECQGNRGLRNPAANGCWLALAGVNETNWWTRQRMNLPSIYPILDFSWFATKPEPLRQPVRFAEELITGGATILQYRDKTGDTARMLSSARELRRLTQGKAKLIINDRADICLAALADGVHLGQDDLSPNSVRKIFDSSISHPFS